MKKFLALLLVVVMLVGVLPLQVFAEDEQTAEAAEEAEVLPEEPAAEPAGGTPAEEALPEEPIAAEETPADETLPEEPVAAEEEPAEEELLGEEAELEEEELAADPYENIFTPENFVKGYDPADPYAGDWSFYDYLYFAHTYDELTGEYTGVITREYAESLMSINANNWGITTLYGIENFPNLEVLDLENNFLKDIDDLDPARLPNLTSITLWKNSLTGYVDFSGFSNLTYLDVDENKLSGLYVDGLSSLETLYVSNNGLEYIDLSDCTGLTYLYASNNRLSYIDLSACTGLEDLVLNDNCLFELDLSACTSLSHCEIYGQYPELLGYARYTPATDDDGYCFTIIDLTGMTGAYTFEEMIDNGSIEFYNGYLSMDGNVITGYYTEEVTEGYGTAHLSYAIYTGPYTDYMEVTAAVGSEELELRFPQDYILMEQGDTITLELYIPESLAGMLWLNVYEYEVTDVDYGEGFIIPENQRVESDGLEMTSPLEIRAVLPGSYFVEYSFKSGYKTVYSKMIRVDVTANEVKQEVLCASLPEKTATVDLFSTIYTSFDFILERVELLRATPVASAPPPDQGVSVTGACFADENVAALYRLQVDDDRTLQIIPTDGALTAGNAGKYSSAINIYIDGKDEPLTTETFTFTVKAAMPKLKAAAVKMNSYTYDNFFPEAALNITGGLVYAFDTVSCPDWLEFDGDTRTVRYLGPSEMKASAKVQLNCIVDGCSVFVPVTVSVSVAPTAPAIKLAGKIPTLNSDTDYARIPLNISIPEFAKTAYVSGIAEGKTWFGDYDYNNKLNAWVEYYNGSCWLNMETGGFDDGKDHTYKVYVYCFGKEAAFSVKVTNAWKKIPYLTAKLSGAIDLSVPNSSITATVTGLNAYNFNGGVWYDIYDVTEDYAIVTDAFRITHINDSYYDNPTQLQIWATDPSAINPSHSYVIGLIREYGNNDFSYVGYAGLKTGAKLSIKSSAASKVQPTLTAKLTGKPDTLNRNITMKVSFQMKNLFLDPNQYIWQLLYSDDNPFYVLVFKTYDAATKTNIPISSAGLVYDSTDYYMDSPFNGWFDVDEKGNIFYSLLCYDYLNTKDKYSVVIGYYDGVTFAESKPAAFSVTRSKAKVTADVGKGVMYVNDNQSELILKFSDPSLNYFDICGWSMQSGWDMFDLIYNMDGDYVLRWKENSVPPAAKKSVGKTLTLKLGLILNNFPEDGSWPAYDATVSIKVKLR